MYCLWAVGVLLEAYNLRLTCLKLTKIVFDRLGWLDRDFCLGLIEDGSYLVGVTMSRNTN
jgi:hypothetical protein